MVAPRAVALIGTGLIGGSIGLALRREAVAVRGFDRDPARAARALELGALDAIAGTVRDVVAGADLVVVAVPVGKVAEIVVEALDAGAPLVTDVGSVKAPVVDAVERHRPALARQYVGGHPMAGSEQEGLDGAGPDLFAGATWVLTPTERTDPHAFAEVRSWVARLGAEAIAVAPELHDALVAVVSHVPQLAASTLMNVASAGNDEHAVLLRLAAGGFRALGRVRAIVAGGERDALLAVLEQARVARRNLPVGIPADETMFELRIPVPDREGVIAEVATLAARLGVNIADLEIAHSLEGRRGVLVLVVAARGLDRFEAALQEHGYHVARTALP